jgi:hypothetical protein
MTSQAGLLLSYKACKNKMIQTQNQAHPSESITHQENSVHYF